MATEISVFDSDEFEQLVANRDLRISKALVETILKNLNGRKRHLHALSVLVEQEQAIYDITVDRQDFVVTLEQNLSILEENEDYETCAKVMDAIKFLKDKKMSDLNSKSPFENIVQIPLRLASKCLDMSLFVTVVKNKKSLLSNYQLVIINQKSLVLVEKD
jgi:hypothetical protein